MNLVEAKELTRVFGRRTAVNKLALAVDGGEVCGLIGPPGAGKTTALRMLATVLAPTGGDALIGGASIRRETARVRRIIGYMPLECGVYPDMTVLEYLEFHAACYGVPAAQRAALALDLLQLVDLGHRKHDPVDTMTRGMRRRLALARALAHDPQVLLLDEPMIRLDARARVEMRELIRELRNMGKAIVLTSRLLVEVEDVCTQVVVLESGRVVLNGSLDRIRAHINPHRIIAVKFFGDAAQAVNCARTGNGVINVRLAPNVADGDPSGSEADSDAPAPLQMPALNLLKEMRIDFAGHYTDASDLLKHLMRAGVQVVSFSEWSDSLARLLAVPDTV